MKLEKMSTLQFLKTNMVGHFLKMSSIKDKKVHIYSIFYEDNALSPLIKT